MALSLSFTTQISNDSTILSITDTTSNWNVGQEIDVIDIDNTNYQLSVIVTKDRAEETVIYPELILSSSTFTYPFTTQADLIFNIYNNMLSGNDSDVKYQDGIYNIEYILYDIINDVVYANSTNKVLINNTVKTNLYIKAMNLDLNYLSQDENIWQSYNSRQIAEVVYQRSCLFDQEASAYISNITELKNSLKTLEKIQNNGANTYWK
jgi:hypothetical protein